MTLQERKLGFWKEYTNQSMDDSIKNQTLNKENSDKEKILNYLNSGIKIFSGLREVQSCVIFNKIFFPHKNIYTDGDWIWTEAFIYYFKNYDILIPLSFIEHLEANYFLYRLKEEDLNQDEKDKLFQFAYSQIAD